MKAKNKIIGFSIIPLLLLTGCGGNKDNPEPKKPEEEYNIQATVADVSNAINDIGEVDASSANLINAISDAFNKLTLADKKSVSNYKKLFSAQKELAMLDGFVQGEFDEGNIVTRLGVISDIHASDNILPTLQILNSYEGEGVDTVVVAGDVTDGVRYYQTGSKEINKIKTLFEENLDNDVDIVLSLGNHDTSNCSSTEIFYDTLGARFYGKADDQTLAREKGLFHMVSHGYHFISLECDFETVANEGIIKDAETYLARKMEEITTSKDYHGEYIFIVNHLVPSGTLYNSSNSRAINNILEFYPQAFVIAGHTHQTIHDELNIDQNRFTVMNPGSVSWLFAGHNYLETATTGVIKGKDYTSYGLPNGSVFEIDDKGNIRINRLDLRGQGYLISEPWIISAPKNNNSHLCSYTMDRLKEEYNTKPYFNDGFAARGSYKKLTNGLYEVDITIDAAIDDNDFIYHYDIDLFNEEGGLISKVKSLSEFYLFADKYTMPEVKTFTVTNLTKIPKSLTVSAMDDMHANSEQVSSDILYI